MQCFWSYKPGCFLSSLVYGTRELKACYKWPLLLVSATVGHQCSATEPVSMTLNAITVLHGVSVMRRCDALPGFPLDSDILQPELRH